MTSADAEISSERTVLALAAGLLLVLGAITWLAILPLRASDGQVAGDYRMFLPYLLNGYVWIARNGLFSVPWFTPAYCGGLPFYGEPQVPFYSLPQWLTLGADPLTAVYESVLWMAGFAYIGMALFAHRVARCSLQASLLCGVLFACNGFFITRVRIGHLNHQAIALLPWAAYAICSTPRGGVWRYGWLVLGGCVVAYMLQSGAAVLFLPLVLGTLGLVALAGLRSARASEASYPWWIAGRTAAVFGLGFALSGARLASGLSFVANFARANYRFESATGVWQAPVFVMRALWDVHAPVEYYAGRKTITHELDYSLTPVALAWAVVGLVYALVRSKQRAAHPRRAIWACLLLSCVLAVIVLNVKDPSLQALLKHIPILRSMVTLPRFILALIPLGCCAAALGLDAAVHSERARTLAAVSSALVAIVVQAGIIHGDQDPTRYNPEPVLRAYALYSTGSALPIVERVGLSMISETKVVPGGNDLFVLGVSSMLCSEPLFGYDTTSMPMGALRPGPALGELPSGTLNFKNPACYLWNDANSCTPGEHFRSDQRASLEQLLRFEPYPFAMSRGQWLANAINVVALLAVLGWLLVATGIVLWRRARPVTLRVARREHRC